MNKIVRVYYLKFNLKNINLFCILPKIKWNRVRNLRIGKYAPDYGA